MQTRYSSRVALNDGWLFSLVTDGGQPPVEESGWRRIDLPHDWQIEQIRDPLMPGGASQGFYPRAGVGYYRLHFNAPREWAGKRVKILFDGVQRFSTVTLNGVKIGERPYGYVPFWVELDGALNLGADNLLEVKVDNSQIDPGDWCGGGDRWYSGAGIYRNVWLLIQDKTHFAPYGLQMTPKMGEQNAEVEVGLRFENSRAEEFQGTLLIQAQQMDGLTVAMQRQPISIAPGPGLIKTSFTLRNPLLWSPETPNLYTVTAVLLDEAGHEIDRISDTTGVRTLVFDGDKGFFINGNNMKLYGVDLHHDGGALGAAVPLKVWRRRFEALKRMGVNAIRCSHNPQAEEFYDLCDEMGFLVIDELYDKWMGSNLYFSRLHEQWWQRDLEAMLLRDNNHPCVVLWSMGNELEIQYSEPFYLHLKEMCDYTRAFDPTRPVSLALIGFCLKDYNDATPLKTRMEAVLRYAEIVDVFMGNYMESFYRELRRVGMKIPIIGSEVFSYYRLEELSNTNILPRSPFLDVKENDFVIGGFVWAGVDYLGESMGWPCHGWTGNPIDSAGFFKLRAYHLMSQFTSEPMVRLGVFDENDPWDHANANWSFPQMRGHWNYDCPNKMMHLGVMTNCEEVRLYLNEDHVRIARPNPDDLMAHFYLPYRPGIVRAEGYVNGEKRCEHRMATTHQPAKVEVVLSDSRLKADGKDIAFVEAYLKDAKGQDWLLSRPMVRFETEGPGDIIAVDNGDFMTTSEIFAADHRSLFNGHCLGILRTRKAPGTVRLKVTVEGFAPVIREIECE